jgi:hypothetical protein
VPDDQLGANFTRSMSPERAAGQRADSSHLLYDHRSAQIDALQTSGRVGGNAGPCTPPFHLGRVYEGTCDRSASSASACAEEARSLDRRLAQPLST